MWCALRALGGCISTIPFAAGRPELVVVEVYQPATAADRGLDAGDGVSLDVGDAQVLGGFNRSSQQLGPRGVYGAGRRMDEAIDREGADTLFGGAFASARSQRQF